MEAFYFFAGIVSLLVVNLYAVSRINKNSYLHTPITLRGLRRERNEANARVVAGPEPTPAQKRMQQYVERFAERQLEAAKKRNETSGEAWPEAERYEPSRSERQQAVVGVAILQEHKEKKSKPAGERNIDRWYRQVAG